MSQAALDHLPVFRSEWTFPDSCLIRKVTGKTLNTTTGEETPTYDTHYDGPGLFRPRTKSDEVYGEQLVVVFDHVLFIPWDEDAPQVNDLVDATSTTDGKLNGKQFTLRGIPTDTWNTRRILLLEDNQGG